MNAVELFRKVSIVEGISAIILFFIAMPLKYIAGLPQAVKIFGTIHGALFVLLCLVLLNVWIKAKWPLGKVVLAFIAANIPFGAFWFEARLKKEEATA